MGMRPRLNSAALREFNLSYDTMLEDIAFRARGKFLRDFPLNQLHRLNVDNYVIGHREPTFCAHVEAKTRSWANIQGATAFKFGIYYGKTKSEPEVTYRYASRFGHTKASTFKAVKRALMEVVSLGKAKDLNLRTSNVSKLDRLRSNCALGSLEARLAGAASG